jgi:hypothetical protein
LQADEGQVKGAGVLDGAGDRLRGDQQGGDADAGRDGPGCLAGGDADAGEDAATAAAEKRVADGQRRVGTGGDDDDDRDDEEGREGADQSSLTVQWP